MINAINHKRVMLANLKTGQCISHIVFQQGKPLRVEAEIIRIEIEHNFGRLWTRCGPLPSEALTFKYMVVHSPC